MENSVEQTQIQSKLVNQLTSRKDLLESQMRLHSGLISHNLIVEVGAYTVAKNDDGNAVLINQKDSVLPTQWTEAGAAEIMQKCEWKNMHGKVMPITKVGYKQWYQRELDQCMETLEILTA